MLKDAQNQSQCGSAWETWRFQSRSLLPSPAVYGALAEYRLSDLSAGVSGAPAMQVSRIAVSACSAPGRIGPRPPKHQVADRRTLAAGGISRTPRLGESRMEGSRAKPDIVFRSWTSEALAPVHAPQMCQHLTDFGRTRHQSSIPDQAGTLSLNMVLSGEGHFHFGCQHHTVRPTQILIVPPELSYGADFRFSTHLVIAQLPEATIRRAMRDCTEMAEQAPEDPRQQSETSFDFPPHLRFDRWNVAATLYAHADSGHDPGNEALAAVSRLAARFVLEAHRGTRRISASRPSARHELFRRVCLARLRIEMDPQASLTLAELASWAALSPFHLLRTFSQAFGETPAQMRRRLLIDRAKSFLADPNWPVGEVAASVGFESHAAFCRAFRRLTGDSPSSYRARAVGTTRRSNRQGLARAKE